MNEKLFSIPLEQAVLTALLTLSAGIDDVMGKLSEDSFYATRHKEIFNHIKEQFDLGSCHDVLVIAEIMRPKFNESFNEDYFKELMASTGSAYLLSNYVDELNELSVRRSLFDAGERIKALACDTIQYDSFDAIEQAESVLASIKTGDDDFTIASAHSLAIDLFNEIDKRMEDRKKGIEKINGAKTGFTDLDSKIGVMGRGELIIIAARPSMGKTALAQDMMLDMSFNQQLPVLFQSAEMPKEAITRRIISSIADIKTTDIRNATVPDDKWGNFQKAVMQLDKSKLMIDDKSMPTISYIRRNCRKLKAQYGYVGAVFVDYLTLLTPPLKTDQNHLAVGSISKALSALAKEFDCPVFCLSQLSRKVEDRADKRPVMSDLRESGQIEQDANTILFIYRDEVYNKQTKEAGIAEIIAAKVRDGEVGTVRLASELQFSRFCDLDSNFYHMQEDN